MSREPSDKTKLATVRQQYREIAAELGRTRADMTTYRIRATKAEQELAEWKVRFDQLLKLGVDRASSQSTGDQNG